MQNTPPLTHTAHCCKSTNSLYEHDFDNRHVFVDRHLGSVRNISVFVVYKSYTEATTLLYVVTHWSRTICGSPFRKGICSFAYA